VRAMLVVILPDASDELDPSDDCNETCAGHTIGIDDQGPSL